MERDLKRKEAEVWNKFYDRRIKIAFEKAKKWIDYKN